MDYSKLQKLYISDVQAKFKRQYNIDLNGSKANFYIKIKYIYNNYIGALFSYFFIKFNFSPNFITSLNIALGLFGLIIFSIDIDNLKIIALIIFFSKNILDNVDGFVARYLNKTSDFGDKLDLYSALVYYFSVVASLSLNNYYLSNNN